MKIRECFARALKAEEAAQDEASEALNSRFLKLVLTPGFCFC